MAKEIPSIVRKACEEWKRNPLAPTRSGVCRRFGNVEHLTALQLIELSLDEIINYTEDTVFEGGSEEAEEESEEEGEE